MMNTADKKNKVLTLQAEQKWKDEKNKRRIGLFDRLVKANGLRDDTKVNSTYGVDKPADGCKSV